MCYNCGCRRPADDMGDPQNITVSTLESFAKEWGVSLNDAKQVVYKYTKGEKTKHDTELDASFQKAAKAWGQTVEDAKKKAASLLEKELQGI